MARLPLIRALLLFAAGLALAGACSLTQPAPAYVRVPPEVLRGSRYTAAGEPSRSHYVVRMTNGHEDWEFQLPDSATAYDLAVPLAGRPVSPMAIDLATATAADREIFEEREAARRTGQAGGDAKTAALARGKRDDDDDDDGDDDGDGDETPRRDAKGKGSGSGNGNGNGNGNGKEKENARGTGPGAGTGQTAGKPANGGGAKPSYLLTLARVKELYRTRKYELALVELGELEKQYPDDERILSMKGSLFERLGNKNLAREAWQQALALNPFNLAVLEALQRLGK
jgi:tetratricopeptide (TPR) repeat protein